MSDEFTPSDAGVDREWYLHQYPDVAASGMDPVYHYLQYGRREGRTPRPGDEDVARAERNPLLHSLRQKVATQPIEWYELSRRGSLYPKIGCALPHLTAGCYGTPGRWKILFTGHEASLTGAPLILLGLMEAFGGTGAELFLILERGGPLLDQFRRIAHVIVNGHGLLHTPDALRMKRLVATFASPAPQLAICNSAESWRLMRALRAAHLPHIVALVHERMSFVGDEALRVLHDDADRVIFPAQAVKTAAVQAFAPFRDADVLPQGLLRPEFGRGDRTLARQTVREELGLSEHARIVLSCGVRQLRKGFDLFVQLAARVNLLSAEPVHFLWLGGDDPDSELTRFVQHDLALLDAGANVSLVAETTDTERYFLAADAFALTSRDDPFPCVVHEAMACALPVVAFDGAGGAAEALAEGCGIVLPYLDIERMARAIVSMVERPADWAGMGERAERRVRSVYRFAEYAQHIRDICDGFLDAQQDRLRPPLSVIIAVRKGLEHMEPVLAALLPQARQTGTEVLVVGPVSGPAPEGVRLVRVDGENIFRMRLIGIREAQGEIVAIGEDHAVPRHDWCEAVLRAHAEHPDVPAIAGCFVNLSADTLSGRANFLAFAAPFEAPMAVLPTLRPPPLSMLSLKRTALAEVDEQLGRFETLIVPRLFAEGRMVADDRIVVHHEQDHGILWSIANGFHGARSAYGYLRAQYGLRGRLRQAGWSIVNWPRRIFGEASRATSARADIAVAALVGAAVGIGGAVGMLAGPGRSPDRVA